TSGALFDHLAACASTAPGFVKPSALPHALYYLESSYVPVALTQACPVPATIGFPLVSGTNSPPPVIPFHLPVPCKNFHFPPPVESRTCSPTTKSPSGTMNLQ